MFCDIYGLITVGIHSSLYILSGIMISLHFRHSFNLANEPFFPIYIFFYFFFYRQLKDIIFIDFHLFLNFPHNGLALTVLNQHCFSQSRGEFTICPSFRQLC